MKETFKIVYEDNHLLVVIKPVNVLSQGDNTGDVNMIDLVNDYLCTKYNKPGKAYVGLLHRLDRPVSGLMIFAKTSKAFERVQKQIKFRTMDKYYLAISERRPEKDEDLLIHFLVKNPELNKVTISDKQTPGSKDCQLSYKIVAKSEGKFLFLIKLITGRSHQIRAQMAYIDCPLMGDVKYGHYDPKYTFDLALYAYRVLIDHPILKERLEWISYPEAKGYWKVFERFFPIV